MVKLISTLVILLTVGASISLTVVEVAYAFIQRGQQEELFWKAGD